MKFRLVITAVLLSSIYGCKTAEEKQLPDCEAGKIYIQTFPAVCKQRPVSSPIVCPETKKLGLPYTTLDEANYRIAIPRCGQLFPASPCLKVFAKVADYTYRAICSAPDGMGTQEFFDVNVRNQ